MPDEFEEAGISQEDFMKQWEIAEKNRQKKELEKHTQETVNRWSGQGLAYRAYLAERVKQNEKNLESQGFKARDRADGFSTADYKGNKVHRCMIPGCDQELDWHTDIKPQFDAGMEWRRKLKQNKAGKAWGGFDLRMLEICECCQIVLRDNIRATGLDDDAHAWYVPKGYKYQIEK